ncbi:hypothetical protein CA54_57860 [Symmachiella macrocystis]|uniref:DUF3887 domain-containing protein n=1 Tax=Symmachiella macrocystis TaxID=2527985 RepID=A0A5C6B604_9PLAN|nr:hypothetical protein [Symmachiella macrocystis]TWU07380.1 hypothetical protein CA54_57860 [Symmachiella macrocystis]
MQGRYLFALILVAICLGFAIQPHITAEMYNFQPPPGTPLDDDVSDIGSRVATFLRGLVNGRTDEAVNDLLEGSPLEQDGEKLAQLKIQIDQSEQQFGKFLRSEKLQLEPIGGSIIRAVYVLHCRRFPVIWRLTFHRDDATREWVLVALSYDTKYDDVPTTESSRRPLQ